MTIGLCITPRFLPNIQEQKELNPPYYRSLLYNLADLQILDTLNKPLVITLNNECREVRADWSGWDSTVYSICKQYQNKPNLKWLVAGNELDIYWHRDKSTPPEFAADIARRAARIAHNFGIKISATSVADEWWPSYLQILADLCRNDVDGFDIHPYGKQPTGWKPNEHWMFGPLVDMVKAAYNSAQKEIIISEYGVKIRDASSEQEVANFLDKAHSTLEEAGVKTKCWFSYSDIIGTSSEQGLDAFGLLSASNVKRPAWYTFAQINKTQTNNGDVVVPEQSKIEQLQKKYPNVGYGLLMMMIDDRTEPLMDSEWRPFDRKRGTPATVEQCIGKNHVTYSWDLPNNTGWRLQPS